MLLSEICYGLDSFSEQFWSRVQKTEFCWLWMGSRDVNGYGLVRKWVDGKSKQLLTHRVAYLLTYNEIPDGLSVCHACDNPPCVNPDHLFLGTFRTNILDRWRKERLKKEG